MKMTNNMMKILSILLVVVISTLQAQNRGNNMAFQGLDNIASFSARTLGMGDAFTSMGGTVDALNFNAAGLATIEKLQISINGGNIAKQWTENQVYNSNRLFVTLPFYLERLYIPDPANNGKLDHEVFYEGLLDSSYNVALPETGNEPFTDEAADWKKKEKASGLTNISMAMPMNIMDKKIVVGASYNNRLNVINYDRNATFLDPHPGYLEYDMPALIETGMDSIVINWSDFSRLRTGSIQEFQGAIAGELSDVVKFGLSMKYFTGETDDMQSLNKVGFFTLYDQNEFSFTYDTLNVMSKGTSTFSGLKTELGLQLVYDAFSFGLNVRMPYTVTREYDYEVSITDTLGTTTSTQKGEDEMKVPMSYAIGVNFHPIEKFTFSIDYDLRKYADTEWTLASKDTTHHEWKDQNILRVGIEYRPFKMLSLRAGYQSMPQVYIPDGAPNKDQGPEAIAYTLGFGLNLGKLGSINGAWRQSSLKYSDIYFSNTNYSKEIVTNILVGYTYNF